MDENVNDQTGTELPSDLTALTSEQLDQALTDARAEAQELQGIDAPDMTDEQVTRLEALADFADRVAERRDAIAAEQAERTERARAAQERLQAPPEGGEGGDGETGDGETGEEGAEVEAAPEAVAAGATRRNPTPAPRRNPTPARPAQSLTTIVAAAEIGGGIAAGSELDGIKGLAAAFAQRAKGFRGMGTAAGTFSRLNVATIERHFDRTTDGLFVGEGSKYGSVQEAFDAASKESRLTNGSLVAAGGWCAPSETLYGIPSDETLDGILDLPTVGVERGGINYTPGPDFSDIFANEDSMFWQTEAQAIAGDEKACVEVDCPEFDEVRLDAVGFCVKAPLLTRAAYPEAIERWLTGTLVANQHKVAARLIAGMRTALGTALVPALTATAVAWSTLTALELVAEGQRQAFRLSDSETLEVKAPRWLRAALRADLANRSSIGAESVTNAQIVQHFADRNVAIEFVLNYLELATPLTNVAFPATVEVMMYPAGTFVKGTADVVALDTLYDTADLQTNVFTAAFVEDGVLLAKMKHGGKRITLPVHITGQLGANDRTRTWGTNV